MDDRRRVRRGRRGRGGEEHPEPEVTIEVSGLSLFTHVGVTAAEREVGQRLLLDLRIDVGECDATVTDRIEDTVDYAQVCDIANLVAQQRSYKTLERLCAAIADRLLEQYDATCGVGQGRQARAADRAAGERGVGRGVARGRVTRRSRGTRGGCSTAIARLLGLGSNVGDRRAHLQEAVTALPGTRRQRAGVVVGVRDRAGRPGARPARVLQRVRAGGDRSTVRRSCSTRARRSSASWARAGGRRAPRAARDRRRRAAARRARVRAPSG